MSQEFNSDQLAGQMDDEVRPAAPRPLSKRIKAKLISIYKRFRYSVRRGRTRKLPKLATRYLKFVKTKRINSRLVVYESYTGAGMICNPFAIFKALLADPRRSGLTHLWVLNTQEEIYRMAQAYRRRRNVRFVLRGSREYVKALATAKYVFQNVSFPTYFTKRPGQICVNTWHSTTVKTLGFDMPDGNIQNRNVIRTLLMSDYVVSPNAFMTKIFRDSFRLQHLFRGKVLEMGYPRNDLTLRADRNEIIQKLLDRGIRVDPNKKIILFAPTWRGASVGEVHADPSDLVRFHKEVSSRIDLAKYQVLIKAHHLVDKALNDEERASGNFIPRQIDANELLSVVDILVSDYSSIYFDFLVTDRPVLFYIPDKESYDSSRGVYFDFSELPGPVTSDLVELSDWINDIQEVSEEYAEQYAEVKNWACEHEDGYASDRVIAAVFDGDHRGPGVIDDFLPSSKKRILFYVSSLAANGVTGAFKALLDRIDRDQFDITVWGFLSNSDSWRNFRELRDVRVVPRVGTFLHDRWESFGIEYVSRYGFDGPLARLFRPKAALKRDLRRSFGDSEFDYLIDFSGYGLLFPNVMRQSDTGKRIIWQHNDLAADIQNLEKRKLKRYQAVRSSMSGLRDIYGAFDKVVACGEHVMELNRRAFARPDTYDKFTFVNNLIETDRVRALIDQQQDDIAVDGYIVANCAPSGGVYAPVLVPDTPPAPDSTGRYLKFVTIGRLSPEKNHENLITGFAQFTKQHPNSRLYVIGDGEMRSTLEDLAVQLGVEDKVAITGYLQNPFEVAKHADCFVLPSRYEGLPLVVPEVRILGLPIILADFPSVRSVSIPNGQHIIGFTADDIAEGLEAFVEGKVPTDYTYDVDHHNNVAFQQFLEMIESV